MLRSHGEPSSLAAPCTVGLQLYVTPCTLGWGPFPLQGIWVPQRSSRASGKLVSVLCCFHELVFLENLPQPQGHEDSLLYRLETVLFCLFFFFFGLWREVGVKFPGQWF